MRNLISVLLVVLTALTGAAAAGAQVRIQPPAAKPYVMVPRVQKAPKAPRIVVVPKPIIPPTVAVQNAMRINPGSQALGVKLKNQTYIVRLKQGSRVTQMGVNSVTGAVTPLP